MENQHDPFLPLAIAATATERVELLTGIAIAFARSPMSAANIGWDLQVASRGRFVMGIGSQVKGHNQRRFSVPWSAPAPRMREYVEALRAIWRCWKYGEKLDYQGEHYTFTLMTPNFVPEHADYPLPPITMAGVGPAMLRVAGEVCDGVRLHPFCTRKYMETVVVKRLGEGWPKAIVCGRSLRLPAAVLSPPAPPTKRWLTWWNGYETGRVLRINARLLAGVGATWPGRPRPGTVSNVDQGRVGQDAACHLR